MTSIVGVRTASRPRVERGVAGMAVATGCVALAARPLLIEGTAQPTRLLVILFVALLLIGVAWPGVRRELARLPVPLVLVVGTAAFALGRLLGGGRPPVTTGALIAANTLAAVAEEAWFRRLCYDALLDAGPVWAVVGSTVLFALVHVGIYGIWVLPLDLAAGLVLGWQRWASGSWKVPAFTHVLANLLVVVR